jgi:acetamidase/formamidase
LRRIKRRGVNFFEDEIYIPLNLFLGVVSLARDEAIEGSTIPPYKIGRNVGYKYITINSVLYLLIKVKGALFSYRDRYVAQGHREVERAAIKTPINITARSSIGKGIK